MISSLSTDPLGQTVQRSAVRRVRPRDVQLRTGEPRLTRGRLDGHRLLKRGVCSRIRSTRPPVRWTIRGRGRRLPFMCLASKPPGRLRVPGTRRDGRGEVGWCQSASKALIPTLLILAFGGTASAQKLPGFDTARWCNDTVAAGEYPVSGLKGCLAIENQDARTLASIYRKLPPSLRSLCENYALQGTLGRGSYAMLSYCIDHESQGREGPAQSGQ